MKKSLLAILISSLFFTNLFSFGWPQEQIVESDSFYSYFGQLRGNTISNSLIFADPSEVKACEDGYLTLFIKDQNDDSDFFPSTLGNAVLISHSDSLMTIYANLDEESISNQIYDTTQISEGTVLGLPGTSAWQQGRSSLEFQVVDTEKNISINPRLLMPRVGKELALSVSEVKIQNVKNGRIYSLPETQSLSSGTYRVFRKRQTVSSPFKTALSLNGTVVDSISFDLLRLTEGLISATGKKNYIKSQIYPNETLNLVGEVSLPPGKNTLKLTAIDILGKQYSQSFTITVW